MLLVCFATAPAILFIFYAAEREREATLDRLELEARHLGSLASREHAHQLGGAKELLRHLGGALSCDGMCPNYLAPLVRASPQLANVFVAREDGSVLCTAVPAAAADLRHNAAFERARASYDVAVGGYVIGELVGRPVLQLAYAVRGPDRSVCEVAFTAVDLAWLDELARQANLPPDYALLIADREGRVLARSGAATGGAQALPALAGVLHREHGAILEVGSPPVSRYFVATPMEGIDGVYVVAGLPYDRVRAEANGAFYRTLFGLFLLTTFTIAAAVAAAEVSVLRVLRSLSRTAQDFGAGELSARAPLPGSHGELRQLATSLNAMAEALEKRHREATEAGARLRALSQRLQLARDAEASRIARELHDELGQVLTSLKLDLARLRRQSPEATAAVAELNERIDGAIDFVRRLSSELRPTVLDRLGLVAALEWLVTGFEEKTGILSRFSPKDVAEPIDAQVSTALFRVAQEALTNIARHADASEVSIVLEGSEDALVLSVRDDGKGIDWESAERPESLGVLGMRERAHLVGGELEFVRGRERGTTLVVRVPRKSADVGAVTA